MDNVMRCCSKENIDGTNKPPKSDRELCHICPAKLSKRELEDLYFALLQSNLELKKTINRQTDKLKLLSTKLQRMTATHKTYIGKDPKECCGNIKAQVQEQKNIISELTKDNENLQEQIKQLNMKLCSTKQFLRRNSNQVQNKNGSRHNSNSGNSGSAKPASTSALNARKSSDATATMKSVSCQCFERMLTTAESIATETVPGGKDLTKTSCDENKCKTEMDELKLKIVNLQEELAKTHEEYSTRISRLENEVIELHAENLKARSETVARSTALDQKETEVKDIMKKLRNSECQCDELHTQLTIEKNKVAELETLARTANITSQTVKDIEDKISNIKVIESPRDNFFSENRYSVRLSSKESNPKSPVMTTEATTSRAVTNVQDDTSISTNELLNIGPQRVSARMTQKEYSEIPDSSYRMIGGAEGIKDNTVSDKIPVNVRNVLKGASPVNTVDSVLLKEARDKELKGLPRGTDVKGTSDSVSEEAEDDRDNIKGTCCLPRRQSRFQADTSNYIGGLSTEMRDTIPVTSDAPTKTRNLGACNSPTCMLKSSENNEKTTSNQDGLTNVNGIPQDDRDANDVPTSIINTLTEVRKSLTNAFYNHTTELEPSTSKKNDDSGYTELNLSTVSEKDYLNKNLIKLNQELLAKIALLQSELDKVKIGLFASNETYTIRLDDSSSRQVKSTTDNEFLSSLRPSALKESQSTTERNKSFQKSNIRWLNAKLEGCEATCPNMNVPCDDNLNKKDEGATKNSKIDSRRKDTDNRYQIPGPIPVDSLSKNKVSSPPTVGTGEELSESDIDFYKNINSLRDSIKIQKQHGQKLEESDDISTLSSDQKSAPCGGRRKSVGKKSADQPRANKAKGKKNSVPVNISGQNKNFPLAKGSDMSPSRNSNHVLLESDATQSSKDIPCAPPAANAKKRKSLAAPFAKDLLRESHVQNTKESLKATNTNNLTSSAMSICATNMDYVLDATNVIDTETNVKVNAKQFTNLESVLMCACKKNKENTEKCVCLEDCMSLNVQNANNQAKIENTISQLNQDLALHNTKILSPETMSAKRVSIDSQKTLTSQTENLENRECLLLAQSFTENPHINKITEEAQRKTKMNRNCLCKVTNRGNNLCTICAEDHVTANVPNPDNTKTKNAEIQSRYILCTPNMEDTVSQHSEGFVSNNDDLLGSESQKTEPAKRTSTDSQKTFTSQTLNLNKRKNVASAIKNETNENLKEEKNHADKQNETQFSLYDWLPFMPKSVDTEKATTSKQADEKYSRPSSDPKATFYEPSQPLAASSPNPFDDSKPQGTQDIDPLDLNNTREALGVTCEEYTLVCSCPHAARKDISVFRTRSGTLRFKTTNTSSIRLKKCSCTKKILSGEVNTTESGVQPVEPIQNKPLQGHRRNSGVSLQRTYDVVACVPQGTKCSRSTSPDNTDQEISSLSDLPSERSDKEATHRGKKYTSVQDRRQSLKVAPAPLSPGEDKATTTYTDSGTEPVSYSLSEGELPQSARRDIGSQQDPELYEARRLSVVPEDSTSTQKVEQALQAISMELARCRQLLLQTRSQEIPLPVHLPEPEPVKLQEDLISFDKRFEDARLTAENASSISLKRAEGRPRIGDAYTPRVMFTLHIGTVVLSDEAVISSRELNLVLTWQFYEQNVAMCRLRPGRVVPFDFSNEYDIKLTNEFLEYMKAEELNIKICEENKLDVPFASCSLPLREALLHTNRRADLSLALVAGPRMQCKEGSADALDARDELGVLDVWCMLRADPRLVPTINKAIAHSGRLSSQVASRGSMSRGIAPVGEDEQDESRNSVDLEPPSLDPLRTPPTQDSGYTEENIPNQNNKYRSSVDLKHSPSSMHELKNQVNFDDKWAAMELRGRSSGIIINEVPANIKSNKEMKDALEKKFTERRSSTSSSNKDVSKLGKRNKNYSAEKNISLPLPVENYLNNSNYANLSMIRQSDMESTNTQGENAKVAEKYDYVSRVLGARKASEALKKVTIKPDDSVSLAPSQLDEYNRPTDYMRRSRSHSIDITILWLALNEECSAMGDPNVQRLYVAYTFLGRGGAELETPISLPKPKQYQDKCHFNFKKSFQITDSDLPILGRMAKARSASKNVNPRESVVFTVVSEPVEDPLGLNNCEDIGNAHLFLGDLLAYSAGNDSYTEVIPVRATIADDDIIGVLAIRVDGLDEVRKCLMLSSNADDNGSPRRYW